MQYYVTIQYSMQVTQWCVCVCVCDIKTTINKLGTEEAAYLHRCRLRRLYAINQAMLIIGDICLNVCMKVRTVEHTDTGYGVLCIKHEKTHVCKIV